ncbi:hypothetical protein BCR44DRAFT_42989 [Catenaria anguillulae PL171]|uniref:Uncharacterized protein n=1 Tax=Catenaria anguillulae PL171 TaxID=765915 RepID=A0A1Y2I3S4_9FUNG|nr:hypothetical protein BCR44DRAFT_42989 [Catenaria anguillulae PL171]
MTSINTPRSIAVAGRPEVNYTLCSVTASLVDSSVYVFGGKSTASDSTSPVAALPTQPYRLTNALFKLDLGDLLAQRGAPANACEPLSWRLLNSDAATAKDVPWPSPRSVHGAAYWPSTNEILVHGGFGLVVKDPTTVKPTAATSDLDEAQLLGDLWAFNPLKSTWRKLNVQTDALSDHTITVDARRNLLVAVGGASSVAGDLILPSLITAVDLHAHEPNTETAASSESSVAQVYLQHYPKAFRRRRHTAAYTSEGLIVVGGRDERFVTQPPLLLKISQVVQAKARHLNHAGGRGITISAFEMASFDALLHQLAPDQLGAENARTYANHSTSGFPRVVQLPAPHSAVLVLSFPTVDGGQWTHATVYDMASGAVVPGIEPVKLAGGPHFALAFNQAIVFLNHTFDSVTVIPYSRFVYFPTDLVAHLDRLLPAHHAFTTSSSLADEMIEGLKLGDGPEDAPKNLSTESPDSQSGECLPALAHIECPTTSLPTSPSSRIAIYPRLLIHIPHLQSALDSRTASTESTTRLVRVPEPLPIVQAVLAYGYARHLCLGANEWTTLAGVYRLAHMWCVHGLQVECCKWVLARVEGQGPRLAFHQDAEDEEAAVTRVWDEAHLVADQDMIHVLEYAFRVWGVEWDEKVGG